MNRLLNTSSITGSAAVPSGVRAGARLDALQDQVVAGAVTAASQPGSTTVVALSSAMIAGPATRWPGAELVAQVDGRAVALAARVHVDVPGGDAPGRGSAFDGGLGASSGASDRPIASTETASTISARSGMRKPKRAR